MPLVKRCRVRIKLLISSYIDHLFFAFRFKVTVFRMADLIIRTAKNWPMWPFNSALQKIRRHPTILIVCDKIAPMTFTGS